MQASGGLPVRAHVAAPRDDLTERQHRRVGRQRDELPAGRCQFEPQIECGFELGHDLDRGLIQTAVLEAQSKLGGALACRNEPVEGGEEGLEVDVPDPRDVLTVGGRVVERDQ